MAEPNQQGALITEAWRILDSIIKTGKATLASGQVFAPESGDFLRAVQFVARFKPPKERSVPISEDFQLKRTDKR